MLHPSHPHPLTPADPATVHAAHSGRWLCDNCQPGCFSGSSPAGRMWHCTAGCDFDVCDSCLTACSRSTDKHPHPMVPADPATSHPGHGARWFCDCCQPSGCTGTSPAGRMWRCLAGCDFDLCESCSNAPPAAPVVLMGVPVQGAPVQTNDAPMGLPVTEGSGFAQHVERIRSALGIDASHAAPVVLAQAATMMGVVPEGPLPQQVERLLALGL